LTQVLPLALEGLQLSPLGVEKQTPSILVVGHCPIFIGDLARF
jgi:hypothetical protein